MSMRSTLVAVVRKNVYTLIALFVLENILFMSYFYIVNINPGILTTLLNREAHDTRHNVKWLDNSRSYDTKINFTWLEHNEIYKKYYVGESKEKRIVTILVIVSSAPKRIERRNSIRNTWWKQCIPTKEVVPACIFMTDYQGPNDKYFHAVREEQSKYKDIEFQLITGGVTFGKRYINHMLFAVKNYQFDYFLRMDDDVFFCLERFLNELPTPSLQSFHWGWIHNNANIRRPEEFLILLSRDVIERFIMQDAKEMLCHPLADQMIAVWLTVMKINVLLRHDSRIHHHPPVHSIPNLLNKKDICKEHIALHGAYQDDMLLMWKQRGTNLTVKGNLTTYSYIVPTDQPFRWQSFGPRWRYEPKLCIKDPTWDTSILMSSGTSYTGREN